MTSGTVKAKTEVDVVRNNRGDTIKHEKLRWNSEKKLHRFHSK